MQSFVAIDFETAIGHHVCSVGIVTVENGITTEEYHALIQPPDNYYNWHNIQVHGIRPEDTANIPPFYEMYPEIKKRLSGKKVVAHNEVFDRNVLKKSMLDYGLEYEDLGVVNRWECTVKIYRKRGYKPANLAACCAVHNIQLNHHDALSDAKACAALYLIACNEE